MTWRERLFKFLFPERYEWTLKLLDRHLKLEEIVKSEIWQAIKEKYSEKDE